MIVEGQGSRAPAPIVWKLTVGDARVCAGSALKVSHYRGYSANPSRWKRGLIEPLHVPGVGVLNSDVAPRFIGNCGEAALIGWLNHRLGLYLSLDDAIKRSGDGGVDLLVGKLTLQVKSRRSQSPHAIQRVSLVRHTTERGVNALPNAYALVFSQVCAELRSVSLLGWVYSSQCKQMTPVPARRGNHLNVEIEDSDLRPMNGLADLLTAHLELM